MTEDEVGHVSSWLSWLFILQPLLVTLKIEKVQTLEYILENVVYFLDEAERRETLGDQLLRAAAKEKEDWSDI